MARLQNQLILFGSILFLGFYLQESASLPHNNTKLELDIIRKLLQGALEKQNGTTLGESPVVRDEDDEDDDRQRITKGVGNILLGAFSLNLKKILNGAFSFADEDIRDNILNVILGHKPPGSEAETTKRPTRTRTPTPVQITNTNSSAPNNPNEAQTNVITAAPIFRPRTYPPRPPPPPPPEPEPETEPPAVPDNEDEDDEETDAV